MNIAWRLKPELVQFFQRRLSSRHRRHSMAAEPQKKEEEEEKPGFGGVYLGPATQLISTPPQRVGSNRSIGSRSSSKRRKEKKEQEQQGVITK